MKRSGWDFITSASAKERGAHRPVPGASRLHPRGKSHRCAGFPPTTKTRIEKKRRLAPAQEAIGSKACATGPRCCAFRPRRTCDARASGSKTARSAAGTFCFAEEFSDFRDLGNASGVPSRRTCNQVFDDFVAHCESRMAKPKAETASCSNYIPIVTLVTACATFDARSRHGLYMARYDWIEQRTPENALWAHCTRTERESCLAMPSDPHTYRCTYREWAARRPWPRKWAIIRLEGETWHWVEGDAPSCSITVLE
jgi:hypothetical protein